MRSELLVQQTGLQESIWAEIGSIATVNFNFQENEHPYQLAPSLASRMQVFRCFAPLLAVSDLCHCQRVATPDLLGSPARREWAPLKVLDVLSELNALNCLIFLGNNKFDGAEVPLTEKWY